MEPIPRRNECAPVFRGLQRLTPRVRKQAVHRVIVHITRDLFGLASECQERHEATGAELDTMILTCDRGLTRVVHSGNGAERGARLDGEEG